MCVDRSISFNISPRCQSSPPRDCARSPAAINVSLFPNLVSRRESDRLSESRFLSLFVDVCAKTPRRPNQLAILALHHKTSRARLPLVRCSSSCTFLCRTHFYLLPLSFHTRCGLRQAVTSISPPLYRIPVGNATPDRRILLHGWLDSDG